MNISDKSCELRVASCEISQSVGEPGGVSSRNSCELRVASCEKEGTRDLGLETRDNLNVPQSPVPNPQSLNASLASQEQLEWATRKDSAEPMPSDLSDAQIQELESLEKAWNWFGNLLENATDDDFRPSVPANRSTATQATPTATSKRSSLRYTFSISVAVLVLVCGFLLITGIVHQPTDTTPIAKNQPTVIINTDVNTSTQEELAWKEDDAYDDELEALSNSMLNAAPGGRWEMSAMAEYSVVGYGMSEWNDSSSF